MPAPCHPHFSLDCCNNFLMPSCCHSWLSAVYLQGSSQREVLTKPKSDPVPFCLRSEPPMAHFSFKLKTKSCHWLTQSYMTGASPGLISNCIQSPTLAYSVPDIVLIALHILSHSIPIIISPSLRMMKLSYKEVS